MTIHASKGMEFDVVFLVGNEDGTFPSNQAIQEGEGSVVLDEERRLCYVAMTRAKDQLIMTWRREVSVFASNGGFMTLDKERSRFLDVLIKAKSSDEPSVQSNPSTNPSTNQRQRDPLPRKTPPNARPTGPIEIDLGNLSDQLQSSRRIKQIRRKTGVKGQSFHADASPPMAKKKKKVKVLKKVKRAAPSKSRSMSAASRPAPAPAAFPLPAPAPAPNLDSTWFFPVGSSVVHIQHGPGKVLTPPPDDEDGEMIVRVKFDSGTQVDLPAMTRDLFPN